MCNVQMIRNEAGLVLISLDQAVFCDNCKRVSNSAWRRCGSCGSGNLLKLAPLLGGPCEPGPGSPATPCVSLQLAA
jgi:hypothetical protein